MKVLERLDAPGKKKLLALDGGGIRGAMTIEVLAGIESMLRKEQQDETLVLSDYFDYIGGTSTGAILAAALSIGMSTAELREFYEKSGPAMFEKSSLLRRYRYKYEDEKLADKLMATFGYDTRLGSDSIRTLLLMVMRNATTDSPWPISNNPRAKYNQIAPEKGNNLHIPLWQLIRASTAAPVYFPPEAISVGRNSFLFVDGGITMFNNPAFQMFLMATTQPYCCNWKAEENEMLIVSVGTGHAPDANKDLTAGEMNVVYNAGSIPSALMAAALHEQDALCRYFGKCLVGDPIDRELGDMKDVTAPGGKKLFTYLRYNAELSREGLERLGQQSKHDLKNVDPKSVQKLDSIEGIVDLQRVGRAVATHVDRAHYRGFLGAVEA